MRLLVVLFIHLVSARQLYLWTVEVIILTSHTSSGQTGRHVGVWLLVDVLKTYHTTQHYPPIRSQPVL